MDYNKQHESQGSATSFCLGHPSHALQVGEICCPICGILAAGAVIGIYQVQRLLGTGRGGYAYLALHQRSNQPVVLKLLPADNTTVPIWDAARREVRVITSLRHNAILSVFSCTTWSPGQQMQASNSNLFTQEQLSSPQETYLLTLCQYVPGNLTQFIAHYQRPEIQRAIYERDSSMNKMLINLIQQAGSAISAAHARGIYHGALVPGNLLFSNQERVWVADFGLARLNPPSAPYLPPELYNASQASIQMGHTGAYWQAANQFSDQYMFAILCQQLFANLLQRHEQELLLPVLKRAMNQRPERRYPTIDLFIQDLVALTSPASHNLNMSPTNRLSISGPQGKFNTGPLQSKSSSGPNYNAYQGQQQATPLPPMAPAGPLTPALPATPITPATPLTPEDWEKRGDKLFTQHKYEEALQAYHRALEINWGKAAIWMALGDTYFALERHKEALMAYEQAMYLNPNDPQTWLNRGTALDALGRHREALDCYERADQLQSA